MTMHSSDRMNLNLRDTYYMYKLIDVQTEQKPLREIFKSSTELW